MTVIPLRPAWCTVGEQAHVVLTWYSHEGRQLARTACGWLITPSPLDSRLPDAYVCITCTSLHPDLTAPRRDPDLRRGAVLPLGPQQPEQEVMEQATSTA
ncbi:MAG: hypothetical protein GEU83_12195 [Pseudonocardiaceae bacterium]|nr:hypothetical protein [Pseudonocardiaceae bacterium]